jgi:hypothetical protein
MMSSRIKIVLKPEQFSSSQPLLSACLFKNSNSMGAMQLRKSLCLVNEEVMTKHYSITGSMFHVLKWELQRAGGISNLLKKSSSSRFSIVTACKKYRGIGH